MTYAENIGAQSDLAVAAFDGGSHALDPAHPPTMDPRQTGVFGPRTRCHVTGEWWPTA